MTWLMIFAVGLVAFGMLALGLSFVGRIPDDGSEWD